MQPIASLLAVLALAQSTLGAVYVTSPVASTVGTGGQTLTVTWADDGQTPTVAQIGVSSIDLYTGSSTQQTFLQNLAASVDVSKASTVVATIDPTVGQSGNYYFVRFQSAALKSTANPQYPYQAFSARFTINGMTGSWNQTVLAQLDGTQPSAATAAPSAATAATNANVAASTKAAASASASTVAAKSGAASQFAAPSLLMGLVAMAAFYAL